MTLLRQILVALAALTLGNLFAPIRTLALIPHSAPFASSQSALHQSPPAAGLTQSEAAVSGMCRNDPVNNVDPLGLETAYENYYEPLGWFGRFEYGVLNLASLGTLAKNDRLVARMERGEISARQWQSASFGNGAVAVGELGLMVGTGGGSTIASGARVGLSVGLADVLGTRANYSGHAIAYEQSVAGDAAQVALAGATFSLAGHANSIYQGPAVDTIFDPVAAQEYAGWVPAQTAKRLSGSSGFCPFGPRSLGAAQANVKVPGYGWKDPKWWRTVEDLRAGESMRVKDLRIAAELRKDAFPNLARSRYRGPLDEMPELKGTYDWHDPSKMLHPGPHRTPHIQIKTTEGKWVRIEAGD